MTVKVFLDVCVGRQPSPASGSASPASCALPLNPIRKLIGKRWVLGSGPRPRWLMGLPDLHG